MDTMEHLARLLSSFIVIVLVLSCSKVEPSLIVNEDHVQSIQRKGIRYVNDTVFSGALVQINSEQGDTISYKEFRKGKKQGTWWVKYGSLQLKEQRQFVEGKKIGAYTAWWPNGKKRLAYEFVNDEYHGTCREWNPNGVLVKEMNYNQGHELGTQKVWYDNGKIKSNYLVKNGRRFGLLGTKNCVNASDSLLRY